MKLLELNKVIKANNNLGWMDSTHQETYLMDIKLQFKNELEMNKFKEEMIKRGK